MKVVIAIDSFKGSLSSIQAGNAAREGVLKVCPSANVIVKPLADGGEGTAKALVEGIGGEMVSVVVTGPMGEPVEAHYGILKDGYAVIEMAEASGLVLVEADKINPWKASSVGVGELILHAIKNGCRKFIVGIGGSATTEGGLGMLSALGYEFLDGEGAALLPIPENLSRIRKIKSDNVLETLDECSFQIACDVKNPLCGENGAVYVYGPQKGVKDSEKKILDEAMSSYANIAAKYTGKDYSELEGAGAAGGLGFAFMTFFKNVSLSPGIDIVLKAIDIEKELADTDFVITGEGRIDAQTAMGKVPVGTAKLAGKFGCKVIAFSGEVAEDAVACNDAGIDAIFPILRKACSLEEAMDRENAKKNLSMSVEQVFRLITALH